MSEYFHNRFWRNRIVLFEDYVIIDEEMSRYLRVVKEDWTDYEKVPIKNSTNQM